LKPKILYINVGLLNCFVGKVIFMGNELLAQVGNVSAVQTPAAQTQTANTGLNTGFNMGTGSLFNMPKDYSNDFMMPDCLKTGNITDEQRASIFGPAYTPAAQVTQPQQYQQQVQYPQQTQYQYPQVQYPQYVSNPYAPAFSGQQAAQPQLTPEQMSEYYEKLLAENPNLRITEKGNLYEVSHTAKKVGILAGIGTALAGGIKKLCTGTALKNAFNLKSLAVKLPVLAVAGWAAGSLIDAFSNSNKAQQADAQTQNA